MHASIVIGNPNPGGRTTRIAEALAAAVGDIVDREFTTETIEVAEVASRLFDQSDEAVGELTARVMASDLVIAACPTYKATYTALLKAFLDRISNNGLAGAVAIPVMVGAAANHALAVEIHLRPVLIELGATVPTRGLYVIEDQVDRIDEVVGRFLEFGSAPLLNALR